LQHSEVPRYIAQQVDAHKEALILMKGYAKDGDTPAIKTRGQDRAGSADASEYGRENSERLEKAVLKFFAVTGALSLALDLCDLPPLKYEEH
jgi:hypothetical protein